MDNKLKREKIVCHFTVGCIFFNRVRNQGDDNKISAH
jgi:hypothetical protein